MTPGYGLGRLATGTESYRSAWWICSSETETIGANQRALQRGVSETTFTQRSTDRAPNKPTCRCGDRPTPPLSSARAAAALLSVRLGENASSRAAARCGDNGETELSRALSPCDRDDDPVDSSARAADGRMGEVNDAPRISLPSSS
jgi:hypothetical protein